MRPLDKTPARPLLSVIIPCFNEEESIPGLLKTLVPHLEGPTGGSWEIVLVDDGSSDATARLIAEAHARENRVRGVFLSRNFGHQPAIFAGLAYASGDYIGIMDADLQDPPEVLLQCFQKAREEGYDLVYALRKRRQASWHLKFCYWVFYRMMRALAESSWTLDAGDFSVFNRRALGLVMELPEHVRVLRGLRAWIGLKQGSIEYDRPGREKGESKYGMIRLMGLALNSLISFSNVPLRLASLVGVAMSGLSVLLGLLLLANRFFHSFSIFGYHIGDNVGTTTIVMLLLFFGSLLFLFLGILGEYLGVIIQEVKRRPVAIVEQALGIKQTSRQSRWLLEARSTDDRDEAPLH